MPVSEVQNDINTIQFLAQTGRFVLRHQCSGTSRRVYFEFVGAFFYKDSVPIDCYHMTDRRQWFELKIFVCVLLKKQSPTSWMPWG